MNKKKKEKKQYIEIETWDMGIILQSLSFYPFIFFIHLIVILYTFLKLIAYTIMAFVPILNACFVETPLEESFNKFSKSDFLQELKTTKKIEVKHE